MGPAHTFESVSRRPPDVEDYIDMLRRYRSWIVGPMFAGLVLATVVAFLWPDTYISHGGHADHAAAGSRKPGSDFDQLRWRSGCSKCRRRS